MLPGVGEGAQGVDTTHFSILDAAGNRVAATITINLGFGSGLVVPDTGVLLNDEMDDFSIKPDTPNAFQLVGGEANSVAPGKRPLSSSTPTFVETPRGLMIAGSPGGSFIIGMVLLATLDFMDGRGAAQIVAAPRFHQQYEPDVVLYESGALTNVEHASLEQRGHKLQESARRWGNEEVVTWDYASGKLDAASDPRGDGEGMVYQASGPNGRHLSGIATHRCAHTAARHTQSRNSRAQTIHRIRRVRVGSGPCGGNG